VHRILKRKFQLSEGRQRAFSGLARGAGGVEAGTWARSWKTPPFLSGKRETGPGNLSDPKKLVFGSRRTVAKEREGHESFLN